MFLCELALELRMPVGELTQRMSAHELGVTWPLFFHNREIERRQAEREADAKAKKR